MRPETHALDQHPQSAAERAIAEIHGRLQSAGYFVLRQLECEYCDGAVILRGCVPSYYLKQVAQSALLDIPAVKSIENRIVVLEKW